MFAGVAATLRRDVVRLFLDTGVRVERETSPGVWAPVGTFRCSAQQPRSDRSLADAERARADEAEDIVFFIDTDTVLEEGMRLTWNGDIYRATAVDQRRSTRSLARVTGTMHQSAVTPQPITFRRRSGNTLIDIGTFPMRVTLDVRGGYDVQLGTFTGGETAGGATQTGTMVGGPESAVLETGDWFGYEGLPGRIATENRSDPGHPRYGIVIEREAL